MKKKYILIYCLILFTIIILQQFTKANTLGQISFEIKRGFLTISGSGTLNIGEIINTGAESRTIPIENILQIKDQSGGCSGHYTTLQISNLSNGNEFISNENIEVNIKNTTTILGTENESITIGTFIDNKRGSVKNPTTHIYRSESTNCGNIGQYGTTGEIKINIPANQSAGTYRGKIYHLLIDNN